MQVDQVDLRDAALVAPEDPGMAQVCSEVSGLHYATREPSRAVVQHEIDMPFLNERIGHKRETTVVVGGEHVAAPVQRCTALHHLQCREQKGTVVFDDGRAQLSGHGLKPQVFCRPYAISVDRKSTRLNSSHSQISYAVFCLKKKK